MASRGKHLLEAFKVAGSSAAPHAPTPAASPAPTVKPPSMPGLGSGLGTSAPKSAPPAAPPASPARALGTLPSGAASGGSPLGVAPAPAAVSLNAPQARLIGLVVLLMVVVAFLLGRMSVSRVAEAAYEGEPPAAAESSAAAFEPVAAAAAPATPPATPPPTPAYDPSPRTPAEQALLDPSNVYTIKAVHYTKTKANERLAAETLRYMAEVHGLPAVVAVDDNALYLLVGAAPRQVDLDDFLARVKRMPGPPPLARPGEFETAYIDKIDKLFRRSK